MEEKNGKNKETKNDEGGDSSKKKGFLPTEIARYYQFPEGLTGEGQSIAILAISDVTRTTTGYYPNEVYKYFKINGLPKPKKIEDVFIIGEYGVPVGENKPGAFCFDAETYTDLEIVGSIAPGAEIYVYFTNEEPHYIIKAIQQMIEDKRSVISISYVSPEYQWDDYKDELESTLAKAAEAGITVCVSSGDFGSLAVYSDEETAERSVSVFAASQYVLACGGTMFTYKDEQPDINNISEEVVWNEKFQYIPGKEFCSEVKCTEPHKEYCRPALSETNFASGGGESTNCKRPEYQKNTHIGPTPTYPPPGEGTMPEGGGRLVPDVAGYASVEKPGYQIYLDKRFNTSGGTSAVAPLYAALFALINEKLKKVHKENPNKYKRASVGCINKLLYELGKNGKGYQQGILTEITKGNNTTPSKKGYKATPGWDACTGWGTINGGKLLEYLLENKH